MEAIEVTTKEELKKAMELNPEKIIVRGKFANDLKKSKVIATASGVVLVALTAAGAAVLAAPATAGISALFALPAVGVAAALTGAEIATIIIAASIGIGLIIAIFKGYDEIEFSDRRLVLKNKRGNKNSSE
ncbi:hypothetical protein ACYULU_15870 [Breznakiellaceae bacterium SP9]